jgi:hypothetical protein
MNPPVDDAAVPATISEAERYQRLRSHLAFLRLPTATEALPAVLDEARAQDWGLVTALERLLAAEVDDTEARRLASRLRFACLPAPWRIADFDFAAQPGVEEPLIRELATLRFLDTASNLLFLGPPGWVRRCSRSGWPAWPWRPGTGCTSPPPRTSPRVAPKPPGKAGGRP